MANELDMNDQPATYRQQCFMLRKNQFVLLRNRPCLITDMTVVAGSGSQQYYRMTGRDIFTGQIITEPKVPLQQEMRVPNVRMANYQILRVDSSLVNVVDETGSRTQISLGQASLKAKLIKLQAEKQLSNVHCQVATYLLEECFVQVTRGKPSSPRANNVIWSWN